MKFILDCHGIQKDKWNPIHLACELEDEDIVKLILDSYPDCWKQVTKVSRCKMDKIIGKSWTHGFVY